MLITVQLVPTLSPLHRSFPAATAIITMLVTYQCRHDDQYLQQQLRLVGDNLLPLGSLQCSGQRLQTIGHMIVVKQFLQQWATFLVKASSSSFLLLPGR